MLIVELEQPDGVRATLKGGEWKLVRGKAPKSTNFFTVEHEQLRRIVSTADWFNLREEMATMMKKAEEGGCLFGRGIACDVDKMKCTQAILELRFRAIPKVAGQGPLYVRLYFTEPKHLPGTLYAAKLAWKHGGHYGKKEQTKHALEAERRVRDYFGENYG